jgi:hypothetical protein
LNVCVWMEVDSRFEASGAKEWFIGPESAESC